jgi:hypothetical protein
MDAQLQMFKEFAHPLGDQIIAWARPEGWAAGITSVSDLAVVSLLMRVGLLFNLEKLCGVVVCLAGMAPY